MGGGVTAEYNISTSSSIKNFTGSYCENSLAVIVITFKDLRAGVTGATIGRRLSMISNKSKERQRQDRKEKR